jgi:hypothetical protein
MILNFHRMNRYNIFFLFFLSLYVSKLHAQDTNSVVVHKDSRIGLLVNKQIEINKNSRRNGPGFRILVISSNNRNKVLDAKTKMIQRFPELKAYMMYQSPFFRLKVGNFVERADAEEYLPGIQKLFDGNVYVVPDNIELKTEDNN